MLKETAINLSEIGEDLENWMTRLPEALKNVPIVYLAIPGSHDSGSCSITPSSTIAPDTSHTIQELGKVFGPIVRRLVYNWVVTQHANITDQLMEGVRYLDLRLATKPQSQDLFFVHGLYDQLLWIYSMPSATLQP
ncbi:PI-PLC X domain-containing protein 3 isoform X2 [Anabrus simplex]|uniref:PI-PLC X domain-containing protein 3 isoform X2 n=1 Tax=Anabrus simplex TaxID=316456 RepID=UPI0034DCF353